MNKYYFNTQLDSPISNIVIENFSNFQWWLGTKGDQFQVKRFDQQLILLDPFLKKYHTKLHGRLSLFKFPALTGYQWHQDGNNLFNLNLTFRKTKSVTTFKEDPQDTSRTHKNSFSIIELNYEPLKWHIFNAQIEHSILNLDNEDRILLTYNVPFESELSYQDMLNELAGPERFELPTPGFEDQHSSTELRTDIIGRG